VNLAATRAGGVSSIGGGAANISSAVSTKEAADAEAAAKEFEKELLKQQQFFQDEMDRLKEIMKKMEEGMGIVMDALSQDDSTNKRIANV
jgi:sorbitol-specific phosphotransferase system component IIBC